MEDPEYQSTEQTIKKNLPSLVKTKIFYLSFHVSFDIMVLNKGSLLVPTQKADDFDPFIDLNEFVRKLVLQRHLKKQKGSEISQKPSPGHKPRNTPKKCSSKC